MNRIELRCITIIVTLIISLFFSSCKSRPGAIYGNGGSRGEERAQFADNLKKEMKGFVPESHQWKVIPQDCYPFGFPSEQQIQEWEFLCEKRNAIDSLSRSYLTEGFANMRQMTTVSDFIELWYHEESYLKNDDLTTWRLLQYEKDGTYGYWDSEFDKFNTLQNTIQSLLLYSPQTQMDINFHDCLVADFQEYYDRLIVCEAIRHSNRKLATALEMEQNAWLYYHAALDSSFRMINDNPYEMKGSAWPMAISGILYDNAYMRQLSLEDFYFAMTDNLDYQFAHKSSRIGVYTIERHSTVSDRKVLDEYQNFFTPEEHNAKTVMHTALQNEMKAWQKWMSARKRVSSLLSGLCKDV